MDINNFNLSGIVATDPKVVEAGNVKYVQFRLCYNHLPRTKDGWGEEVPMFFTCSMREDQLGARFMKRAKKGYIIFITGQMQARAWENEAGEKRVNHYVSVLRYRVTPSAKSMRANGDVLKAFIEEVVSGDKRTWGKNELAAKLKELSS
ncbi:MAG: single-stranded DNA-binding protein [Candidatus Thorarchaeota archaeon]|jgi:single-stranded DNA-binding protein